MVGHTFKSATKLVTPIPSVDSSFFRAQNAIALSESARKYKSNEAVHQVMRMCSTCAAERDVQRQPAAGSGASGKSAPPIVSDVLSSGGGKALDGSTRQFMESRFGQDFSTVRIHTSGRAAASAAAIQARAYTSGRHVVFGEGQYQPESESGKRLLAHELTHVGQQAGQMRKIQREGDPDAFPVDPSYMGLGYRFTFPSGRRDSEGRTGRDGRHELFGFGPQMPVIGHPSLGIRYDGGTGRFSPVAGQDAFNIGSRLYSPVDISQTLRGMGGSSNSGATTGLCMPLTRMSPFGCCPMGQNWNPLRLRCDPHYFSPAAFQQSPLQLRPPQLSLPPVQRPSLLGGQQLHLGN